jgi:nicotinamidase-related amidase
MYIPGSNPELPLPPHYKAVKVGEIWKVAYQEREKQAHQWASEHHIQPAATDALKIALIIIDAQNTFCIPGFELFVGGQSGMGAVEDNRRLCEFIYRNLGAITQITATLDTHTAMQIFHPVFLVDAQGEHPAPLTLISADDLSQGLWKFNPAIASSLNITPEFGQAHLLHYAQELKERHKYDLTIWPYHVMLGSIGHALVPAVEEAIFFHTIARSSQADFEIKGGNPLTEHYSVIGPEVLDGPDGESIAQRSRKFIHKLRQFDRVIIAGQAKSHCVAWTIADLLSDIREHNPSLVSKVYLLEDCTSPVVVPGVVDYSDQADEAFRRFKKAGMHVVSSTEPIETWPEPIQAQRIRS